jgi:NADH-quinone oxidoreductase subunit C
MNDITQTTPEERLDALADNLREQFEQKGCEILRGLGEITMVVPVDQLLETALELRDSDPFLFQEVIDICGVDYSTYGESEWDTAAASSTGFGRGVEKKESGPAQAENRFAAVYHLLSVSNNLRLRLRVMLSADHPIVPSVVDIWRSADWNERETFDLFGILFDGHPDLRRILTDYGFVGHPFRKDFPITGHVEMRYDPEKQRVVYEPVSIEARTQVPKVIREDNRYVSEKQEPQDTADA